MPASTLDPVNAALRTSLSKSSQHENNALDNQLVGSTKKALLSNIEFESAGSYQNTVLDKLKSKYIVLKSAEPTFNNNNSGHKSVGCESNMGGDESLSVAKHELFPLHAVQLGWNNSDWAVGAGMVNMGNTCYLNSTLQALFHVPSLVNWLISDKQFVSECEDSGTHCIICAMRKTLQDSQQRNNNNSIRPFLIYNKLRVVCRNLIPGRQEDAHEFLRYLVEAMEKSYLNRFKNHAQFDSRTKETTPLNQILGGYLRSAVRCLSCGHVSTTFQHFQDLLLDIRKAQTLDEALDGYFSKEQLDDDSYHCEACQKKVPATKQFSLERAPMVLCIQLKRFSVTNNKITKNIQFKQRLELSRYARHKPNSPLVYRLVALVTHMGPTVNCGHYTAVAQAPCGNFYQFDDSMVRPISHQAVFATNAYIMLYELESAPSLAKPSISSPIKLKSCNSKSTPEKSPALPQSIKPQQNGNSSDNKLVYGPELPPNKTKPEDQNGTISSSLNGNAEKSKPKSPVKIPPQKPTIVVTSTSNVTKLVPYDEDDSSSEDSSHSNSKISTKAANGEWRVTSSTDNLPSEGNKRIQAEGYNTASGSNSGGGGGGSGSANNTVNQLLKMSHGGYSAPVSTWNGTRAQLDKEIANEKREERKRILTDDADQGRVKHIKTSNGNFKSNPGYNPIQEHHNAKNWDPNSSYRPFYSTGGRNRNRRTFHHKNNYHATKSYRFRQ